MDMSRFEKEKKVLIVVGVVVLLTASVLLFTSLNKKQIKVVVAPPTSQEPVVVQKPIVIPQVQGTKDHFREEVPANTKVPEMNEKLTVAQAEKTAVPGVVTPAAPGSDSNFRSFEIRAEGGKFTPNEIIARKNDIVHISFTAVDKAYDIVFPSYGMSQQAKQGQKKNLEFQALSSGSFSYYCDSCGGMSSQAKGKIIIVN
ncbi:MAG: cupredoxin domain-containing protein [Patescibacteria group bacterium]